MAPVKYVTHTMNVRSNPKQHHFSFGHLPSFEKCNKLEYVFYVPSRIFQLMFLCRSCFYLLFQFRTFCQFYFFKLLLITFKAFCLALRQIIYGNVTLYFTFCLANRSLNGSQRHGNDKDRYSWGNTCLCPSNIHTGEIIATSVSILCRAR